MTSTQQAETAAGKRARALSPYLERFDAVRCAEESIETSVDLDDQSVELDRWERGVLRAYAAGTDPAGHPWPSLVPEGLAFIAKCHRRTHSESSETTSDEAILETAAGLAILSELQLSVDQLIASGRVKEVKGISDFRNKVRRSVDAMRALLGGETTEQVESLAEEILAERETPITPPRQEDEPRLRSRPTQFKRDAAPVRVVRRTGVRSQRLLGPLLAVFVLVASAWFVLFLARPRQDEMPVLTKEHFAELTVVRSIEARPPSLFVHVNSPRWNDLGEDERLETIRTIGDLAGRVGYMGAQIWSDDLPVARWSKKRGPELTRTTTEGS